MADNQVVGALVKKRAALAGEIERTHETLRKMVNDLEHLDQTITQFDPNYQVESIRAKAFRPPKDWSNRGQMSRIVLSILRQAAEPLTSRDIALELLVQRALDKNDQRLLRLMSKRVAVALRGQRDKGTVRSDQGLLRLGHGLVGQADDVEGGKAGRDLDLHVHRAGLDALERHRGNALDHVPLDRTEG